MTQAQRQWAFTLAALFVLLGLTALGNNLLTVGVALVLLIAGFRLLPRDRALGALAAVVAACSAAAIATIAR